MRRLQDLQGQQFGRLTALLWRDAKSIGARTGRWLCTCSCGKTTLALPNALRSGHIVSCGCYNIERFLRMVTKDGTNRLSERSIWHGMLARCENPDHASYARYGGRGIAVCQRWHSFANFYADMGPRPSDGLSLDRVDNDGDYEPGNCRWATALEQANNRRRLRLLTLDGVSQCVSAWGRSCGLSPQAIYYRLNAGWSVRDALKTTSQRAAAGVPPATTPAHLPHLQEQAEESDV